MEKKDLKKDTSYSEGIQRLQEILNKIEHNSPDVDELMTLTEEAVQLIQFCREKLNSTDKRIEELLTQLNNEHNSAS